MTTDLEFRGYADLLARWPTLGITVTENPDGSLTLGTDVPDLVAHDLVGISTNLLTTFPFVLRPAVRLKDNPTLSNVQPPVYTPVLAFTKSRVDTEIGYRTLKADPLATPTPKTVMVHEFVYTVNLLTGADSMPLHRVTVAELKSLQAITDGQARPGAPFFIENARLKLTPFGLTLLWDHRIPLDARGVVSNFEDISDMYAPDSYAAISGQFLVLTRKFVFTQWGWPTVGNPAFISPRKQRIVARTVNETATFPSGGEVGTEGTFPRNPNIENQLSNVSGGDFSLKGLPRAQKNAERTELAILQPLALKDDSDFDFEFSYYENPDNLPEWLEDGISITHLEQGAALRESRAIRMNGLREHYNALANAINSLKSCQPYTWQCFRGSLHPNSGTPFGGRFIPANQYAGFVTGTPEYEAALEVGIPFKREADFPPSYAEVKDARGGRIGVIVTVKRKWVFDRPHPTESLLAYYDFTASVSKVDIQTSQNPQTNGQAGLMPGIFGGAQPVENYRWVSIEDAKAHAETAGFLFHFERVVVPWKLTQFDPSGATLIAGGGSVERQDDLLRGRESFFQEFTQVHEDQVAGGNNFAGVALFIEAVTDDEAQWVSVPATYSMRDFRAGDFTVTIVPAPDIGLMVYRVSQASINGLEEFRYFRKLTNSLCSPNVAAHTPALLVQNFSSESLSSNMVEISIPVPAVEHTSESFSLTAHSALGRATWGPQVIPIRPVD